MMKSLKIKLFIAVMISLAVFTWSLLFRMQVQKYSLPVFGATPEFSLYDTNAKEFHVRHLLGKVSVADFIFTTCSGVCPLMSQNMRAVYQSYASDPRVQLVSISVNPEYDSPAVLAEYAKRYGANTAKWHFLTGPKEEISNLAIQGFKIGSVEEPVFHSSYFVLLDRKAKIRGYYDGTKPSGVKQLTADIAVLLKEND